MRSKILLLAVILLLPSVASARSITAGDIRLMAGVGPGGNVGGSRLGAAAAYFLLDLQATYAFTRSLGAVVEVGIGGAETTIPFRARAGLQFHIPGLRWPVLPYLGLQFSVAQLFNVLGAELTYLGARLNLGVDYLLTKTWGLGIVMGFDAGSTLGTTPAFYGTVETIGYASFAF